MDAQLGWDGVVYPIQNPTFAGVLETAQNYEGLDVSDSFFVQYKDEEGETIEVRNEIDMAEAVRWAQELQIPLCLEIPLPSHVSDDDWDVVSNGSQKGSPRQKPYIPQEAVDLNQAEARFRVDDHDIDENDEALQEVADGAPNGDGEPKTEAPQPLEEVQEANEEGEVQEVNEEAPSKVELTEASHSENPSLGAERAEQSVEDTSSTEEDPAEVYEVAQDEEESSFVIPMGITQESGVDDSEITAFVEKLLTPEAGGLDGTVPPLEVFLWFLSKRANVGKLATMLQNPKVQNAIAEVCFAESTKSGTGAKVAKAQIFAHIVKDMVQLVRGTPQLEEAVLRLLNPKPFPSKVEHPNVECDGCAESEARAEASIAAGNRTVNGFIAGNRWKSSVRPNYDLCDSCEKCEAYQKDAPYLKIVEPANAPEFILCALPGATGGMMSQVDALDWRNPLAKEFVDFVKSRQERAFPQQRQAQAVVVKDSVREVASKVAPPEPVPQVAPLPPAPVPTAPDHSRCPHTLRLFETSHGGFTCDVCLVKQAARSLMYGCRKCNYDICEACDTRSKVTQTATCPPVTVPRPTPSAPLFASILPVPTSPPQAKFVADVTLADGSVVRPGEHLSKTWRVRNSGLEKWQPGTRIVHVGGDSFGGPLNGVEVPLANPGEAVNVTVPLVMPTVPGRYTSYWRMMTPHPNNARFGHRFWITCVVVPAPPPPPMPTVILPPPPPPSAPIVHSPPALPSYLPPPVPEAPVVDPQFELAVSQITEFGFADIDKIVSILRDVNGDAGRAIDRLLAEDEA